MHTHEYTIKRFLANHCLALVDVLMVRRVKKFMRRQTLTYVCIQIFIKFIIWGEVTLFSHGRYGEEVCLLVPPPPKKNTIGIWVTIAK